MYQKYKPGDILKGIKFLGYGERSKDRARGIFQCPFCPATFQTFIYNVSSGHATSCGCERRRLHLEAITKHGHCKNKQVTSEYGSYSSMMDRCYRPKTSEYKNYGGRGITVCDRWKESFSNFIEDMGLKSSPDLTIGRIDNDGNYELSNCRWETDLEQSNNTRRNIKLTFNGKTQTQSQWARELGISETTIKGRRKANWPIEKILSPELFDKPNTIFVDYKGEKKKLNDVSKELGLDPRFVKRRLSSHGYTLQEALFAPKFNGNIKRHHKPVSNFISHSFGVINKKIA